MRAQRTALLCFTAAALTFALVDGAFAQKMFSRGPSPNVGRPLGPTGGGSVFHGGGFRGPGWGAVVPGVIVAVPQGYPPDGPFIDDGPRRSQQASRRGASGAPPANERRLVPDEVVIELSNSVGTQQINALQRRFRLTRIESQAFQLSNTTLYRWRIPDRRSLQRLYARSRATGSSRRRNRIMFLPFKRAKPGAKAILRNTNSPSCICRRRMLSPRAIMCWLR